MNFCSRNNRTKLEIGKIYDQSSGKYVLSCRMTECYFDLFSQFYLVRVWNRLNVFMYETLILYVEFNSTVAIMSPKTVNVTKRFPSSFIVNSFSGSIFFTSLGKLFILFYFFNELLTNSRKQFSQNIVACDNGAWPSG